ncbi:AIPR family protein [Sorangium sp. So ce381]|uniref:AIPR family protein n=1 Tax=Sorangium sp. So ce381 TaxID=3133307 RepID=UPI003F5B676B
MSDLHVRQIKSTIEKTFRGKIDVSDLANHQPSDQENGFLTRALAALALAHLASIEPQDAANSITDGSQDNGIDAVYYHPPERILYLVQSKWRHDGSGSVERGDLQKFLKGVKDLINARWDRFPTKLKRRKAAIEQALNDATTRISLVVVYTGQAPLSNDVKQDLQDILDELNDPTDLVYSQVLRQADVYAIISKGIGGAPIDVDVQMYEWGQIREPFHGFYGQVAASDVAQWMMVHQNRLFAPNLRVFLGVTSVNASMVDTLTNHPEHFWYFNNGITALCRKVVKKPLGGNTHETGLFECSDLRVVNGAQTVGAITEAATKNSEPVSRARVWVRLISLENCPEGFDKEITRFNNSQNRIEHRDFVALDPEQERIASELALEGITYLYKSGETLVDHSNGLDLAEATVARACRQTDITFTVNAKAEIGRLWQDIERAPYKVLFNSSVSGPSIWRLVQILRLVESQLVKFRKDADGRKRLLVVHGNRFVAHTVMRTMPSDVLSGGAALDEAAVVKTTKKMVTDVLSIVNQLYADAYLANLFKNIEKCRQVASQLALPPTK